MTTDAAEGLDQGNAFSLSSRLDGRRLRAHPVRRRVRPDPTVAGHDAGRSGASLAGQAGASTSPLPDDQQPDQDDPVGEAGGAAPLDGMPEIQLFDRTSGRWMEFAHMNPGTVVSIAEPERYVDSAGHLLARFVNRVAPNNGNTYFSLATQLEGSLP